MPTLTAGQTGTFTLDAFGYIDVVAQGDGTLNATSRAPNLKSNVAISRLASVRYGPYGVPMDFTIACTNGAITYTTTAGYGGGGDAEDVSIADAGGYFTGTDVEAALQELGPLLTAGSSSLGGGGSDRTAVTEEVDPVNGGYRVLSETVDGIPWTYTYDVQGRLEGRTWSAGGLSATITYNSNGFGTASGNIIKGDSIVVTSSQMATLKTALAALSATENKPKFYVSDFDSSRGLELEWNPVDECFRFPGGTDGIVGHDTTTVTATDAPGTDNAESAALYTITIPGWLRGPKSRIIISSIYNYSDDTPTKTTRFKLNGTTYFTNATTAPNNGVSFDNFVQAISTSQFVQYISTSTGGSGSTVASSSPLAAPTTITADTDIAVTMTMQWDGSGTAGRVRTAYGLMVRLSNP